MKKNNFLSLMFSTMLVATSCQKSSLDVDAPEAGCKDCITEEYKSPSGNLGVDAAGVLFGRDISYKKIDGLNVLEGDIIVDASQLGGPQTEGTINNLSSRFWPNRTIVYAFASGLPQSARDKFISAAQNWANNLGFTFIERTNQASYINVIQGSGCFSSIGRTGRRQDLSIGVNCSVGNAIHEIGHAVGLYHEQSRSDRDNSIIINFQNITPGFEGNFNKCNNCSANGSLDFGSIMMYGPTFFSRNSLPTITRRNGSSFTVQRNGLSNNDKAIVNSFY